MRMAARATTELGPVSLEANKQTALALLRAAEAARELSRYAEGLDMDSARQSTVEKRLAAAEDLARKHRVAVGELPAHCAALEDVRVRAEQARRIFGIFFFFSEYAQSELIFFLTLYIA